MDVKQALQEHHAACRQLRFSSCEVLLKLKPVLLEPLKVFSKESLQRYMKASGLTLKLIRFSVVMIHVGCFSSLPRLDRCLIAVSKSSVKS